MPSATYASSNYISDILADGQAADALAKKSSGAIVNIKLEALNRYTLSTSNCSVTADVTKEEKMMLKPGGGKQKQLVAVIKLSKTVCNK